MKILSEKIVNTEDYAGTIDILLNVDDFESEVTYDPLFHTYRRKSDNKILPSVTRLLSDDTYSRVPEEVLKRAELRGSAVHKEVENFIKRQEVGITDEFQDFTGIYSSFIETCQNEAIIDLKTYAQVNKKNKEKCYKQIKMYAEGVKHLTGVEIKDYYMLWLPHGKNQKAKLIDLRKEFEHE